MQCHTGARPPIDPAQKYRLGMRRGHIQQHVCQSLPAVHKITFSFRIRINRHQVNLIPRPIKIKIIEKFRKSKTKSPQYLIEIYGFFAGREGCQPVGQTRAEALEMIGDASQAWPAAGKAGKGIFVGNKR
jgi:hypothetical protein